MMQVVLLNASYEPLGGVAFRHAVGMLVRGVATVEEQDGLLTFGPYPRPRVIRLVRFVATTWLYKPAGFSKPGVLARDRRTCAFCGGYATTASSGAPAPAFAAGSPWLSS